MDNAEVSRELFAETKKNIPSADTIASLAMDQVLGSSKGDKEKIKASFSYFVTEVQIVAYQSYQEYEAIAAGKAIRKIITPMLPPNATAHHSFDFLETRFPILDRFYLSLTQSRRPRAGNTFETVVSELFKSLAASDTVRPALRRNSENSFDSADSISNQSVNSCHRVTDLCTKSTR